MSGKGRAAGDEEWPALSLCESASRRERRGGLPASGEQCEPLRHSSASSFTQGKHGHNEGLLITLQTDLASKDHPGLVEMLRREPRRDIALERALGKQRILSVLCCPFSSLLDRVKREEKKKWHE